MSVSTSPIAYHRAELDVARDITHPQRLVPDPGAATCILDIGCGAGQTIAALGCGRRSVGIDIDRDALRYGASGAMGDPLRMAAATGEQLPFRDGAFDFVYSRVALPYMNIPIALAEAYRVLRPGGRIWLSLHPIAIPLEQFRRGNLRGRIYAACILANGVWFHVTGRTIHIGTRIRESIQTERGMRLALTRAGFCHVEFRRSSLHFVVTAAR
jgi:SAM-dependent methyltransferase